MKINLPAVALIALIFLSIAVIFNYRDSSDEILRALAKTPGVKQLGNATVSIEKLTNEGLDKLRAEQPVIYSNSTAGDYLVTFRNSTDSLIIIYDLRDNIIVNMLSVRNVVLDV